MNYFCLSTNVWGVWKKNTFKIVLCLADKSRTQMKKTSRFCFTDLNQFTVNIISIKSNAFGLIKLIILSRWLVCQSKAVGLGWSKNMDPNIPKDVNIDMRWLVEIFCTVLFHHKIFRIGLSELTATTGRNEGGRGHIFWHQPMCADSISLTLLCLCAPGHVCVSVRACGHAYARVGVCRDTRGTCVPQITPHVCVGFPPPPQVWLMHGSCGAEHSGPRWLDRPGIMSERGPQFALSEGMVHLLNTTSPTQVHGRSVLDQPPAGRIRCYLSDWAHYHQSLPSTSLRPGSNRRAAIHLRRWRADKISNRARWDFATFAWCVKEVELMGLSPRATGSGYS